MKQFTKSLLAVVCVLALAVIFAGCPSGDEPTTPTKNPPADIVVKDSSGTPITSLTLALDDTETLTVSATGATEYWWELSGGDAVELSSDEGATTTVTAKKIGTTTKIKVYAGNNDGSISKEISVTVQAEVLQLQITKVSADGNEILETEKITLLEGNSAPLSFEVKDENGAAVTGATINVISNAPTTATITTESGIQKVNGVAAGDTTITITATKQGYKASASVTREVKVLPADTPILSLTVGSGGTGTWVSDTLTIKDTDTLTLSAAGTVSGSAVTLTSVDWEVTGTAGIVTVDSSTGVVTVVKPGTTQIKVTAQAAEAEDSAMKTITLVVKSSLDLLFEWKYADNPWTANLASGNSLKLPSTVYETFFNQGTAESPKYVSTIMNLGANIALDTTYGGIRSAVGNNPRVSFGKSNTTPTDTSWTIDTLTGGEINLYRKKVRLTVDYADPVTAASNYLLRIYVFNTWTGGNFGPFAAASDAPCNIVTYQDNSELIAASDNTYSDTTKKGTLVLEIDTRTAAGAETTGYGKGLYGHENERELGEAFITLHTQTNSGLTITGVKIELLADDQVGDVPPRVPKAGLTIKDSEGNVVSSLPMEVADEVTLTAVTESGATITWASDKTDIATVTPSSDGTTATIKAIAAGSATITITTSHPNFRPNTATVSVTVIDGGVAPNTNTLIFEWTAAANGAPAGMTWSTGTNAAATVSTAKLTGNSNGIYTQIPISLASGGNNTASINYNNGIRFDADTANARILVLGAGFGKSVSTASTHQEGVFDFSALQFPAGKTQIQVTLTIASFTGGNGNFSVTLNNNTTTAASCPLTPNTSPGARIIYHQTPSSTAVAMGNNGSWDGSTTYVSRAFKPDDFSAGANTLATAFIGIAHTSNATSSNAFTITGIKIEYVN